MNKDDIKKHCEEAYGKWDFINRIVELYMEGVAWKGCDLIEVEMIKEGVRSMLVTGTGSFNTTTNIITIQMPRNTSVDNPGSPFLWPVTQNAKVLVEMENSLGSNAFNNELFLMIVKDICLGLGIPYELLGLKGRTVHGDIIMMSMVTYISNVKKWRDYLRRHLKIIWNEEWLTAGFASYGQVYQVFKTQAINLDTMANQVLISVKTALDNSLISRQKYNQSVKWFLEN